LSACALMPTIPSPRHRADEEKLPNETSHLVPSTHLTNRLVSRSLRAGFRASTRSNQQQPCDPLSQYKPTTREIPYGWVRDNSDQPTRVPVVDFDYGAVFQELDGDVPESKSSALDTVPLVEILSPRELQHAYAIAQSILRRTSPKARAIRAAWRDPVKRQKWISALRQAGRHPEERRKKSETMRKAWRNPVSRARLLAGLQRMRKNPQTARNRAAGIRRAWQTRDRDKMRNQTLRIWRERRPEMVAKIRAATCSAKFRQRASEHCRAIWANPILRQKFLAVRRTPEARRRTGLASCRYYAEHPEAGLRAAERARAMWRKPGFRSRRRQAIAARKVPDPSLSKTE